MEKGDLISRERLINEWNDLGRRYAMPTTPIHKRAIREFPSADVGENKGEWIPVSERLPVLRTYKTSDDVLITNGYEIDMGYLVERKGKIFWHYYGSDYEFGIKDEDNDAIAWMSLPEPYKAEREKT